MANEPGNPATVTYTPEFKRNLRHLAKKYRHIHDDIQPAIDQLTAGANRATRSQEWNRKSSRCGREIQMQARARVAAIASSIMSGPKLRQFSSRSTLNPNKEMLLLPTSGKSSLPRRFVDVRMPKKAMSRYRTGDRPDRSKGSFVAGTLGSEVQLNVRSRIRLGGNLDCCSAGWAVAGVPGESARHLEPLAANWGRARHLEFSNGWEVRLLFRDVDTATAFPMLRRLRLSFLLFNRAGTNRPRCCSARERTSARMNAFIRVGGRPRECGPWPGGWQ